MFETVERSAREVMETIRPQDTERIGSPSQGDAVRQGDVYLVCLGDDFKAPEGYTEIEERQLAPGETQGSRHILDGDVTVWAQNPVRSLPNVPNKIKELHDALIGPSFRCNTDSTVTHPEHGDKILPAGTSWGVTYRRVYGEEVRRDLD